MGPNGIGVIDTHTPLNTTFVKGMPPRGQHRFPVAVRGTLRGDHRLDPGPGHRLQPLPERGQRGRRQRDRRHPIPGRRCREPGDHPLPGGHQGRAGFYPALREAAAHKPVLAIKAGRTASGQAATASHTGALAGVHAAFRGCLPPGGRHRSREHPGALQRRAGVGLPAVAARQPHRDRHQRRRAGGPGSRRAGRGWAAPGAQQPDTQAALPPAPDPRRPGGRAGGPAGGADEQDYRRALDALLADPDNDGVLAILVPQALVDPVAWSSASAAAAARPAPAKPVLACLMGEASLDAAFRRPTSAADSRPTPSLRTRSPRSDVLAAARAGAAAAQRAGSAAAVAAEPASRQEAARRSGWRAAASRLAGSALDAAEGRAAAGSLWCRQRPADVSGDLPARPAASPGARLPGRPEAGQPRHPAQNRRRRRGLDVPDEAAVRRASTRSSWLRLAPAHPERTSGASRSRRWCTGGQEVIVGMKRDPTFGPLVMFGLGGRLCGGAGRRQLPAGAADASRCPGDDRRGALGPPAVGAARRPPGRP